MTPILITAPAAEPVGLPELKLHLRLDGAAEDALLSGLAAAARLTVEALGGCKLCAQGWRLVLDAWPADGLLRLPLRPLRGVAAVRVWDADGAFRALPAGAWTADLAADPPRLLVPAAPAPARPLAGIEIDLDAGYGPPAAVPEPLRLAVKLLAAAWYEERGDGGGEGGAVPPAVAALLAPYREVRL